MLCQKIAKVVATAIAVGSTTVAVNITLPTTDTNLATIIKPAIYFLWKFRERV